MYPTDDDSDEGRARENRIREAVEWHRARGYEVHRTHTGSHAVIVGDTLRALIDTEGRTSSTIPARVVWPEGRRP